MTTGQDIGSLSSVKLEIASTVGMTYTQKETWKRQAAERAQRVALAEGLVGWLASLPFTHFHTVTYRPPRRGHRVHHSYAFCSRHLWRWFGDLSEMHGGSGQEDGSGLAAVVAWEEHKSGALHAHTLLLGAQDELLDYDSIHAAARADQVVGIINIQGLGRDSDRIKRVRYVAKYIGKQPGHYSYQPKRKRWAEKSHKHAGEWDMFNVARLARFTSAPPGELAFSE